MIDLDERPLDERPLAMTMALLRGAVQAAYMSGFADSGVGGRMPDDWRDQAHRAGGAIWLDGRE